jgi:hypothetical protein
MEGMAPELELRQTMTFLWAMGFNVFFAPPFWGKKPTNEYLEAWATKILPPLILPPLKKPTKSYLQYLQQEAKRKGIKFKKPKNYYKIGSKYSRYW